MSRKDRKKARAAAGPVKGIAQAKAEGQGKVTTKTAAGHKPVSPITVTPRSTSPKGIERAHEIDGFKAEVMSLKGKLKASDIKVERLLENRTQLQHDLSVVTKEAEAMRDEPVVVDLDDAKLIGFFAVLVTAGRPRFFSFPVIPTFGASGPEIDLKNQLNEPGEWQGFRLYQAGEVIIFDPYDAGG